MQRRPLVYPAGDRKVHLPTRGPDPIGIIATRFARTRPLKDIAAKVGGA